MLFDYAHWCTEKTLDRDRFQSADEARDFGLIDEVIERRPEAQPM